MQEKKQLVLTLALGLLLIQPYDTTYFFSMLTLALLIVDFELCTCRFVH